MVGRNAITRNDVLAVYIGESSLNLMFAPLSDVGIKLGDEPESGQHNGSDLVGEDHVEGAGDNQLIGLVLGGIVGQVGEHHLHEYLR